MQTNFSDQQRQHPLIQQTDEILRKCVHCGFCTATCPTYVLRGNELDSPRGRIYQIKDMFEAGQGGNAEIAKHLDRCLSCLSCMTTCPSGVHYMHLVDMARAHVEETWTRPWFDRLLRATLAMLVPYPKRFGVALKLAKIGRPFASLFGRFDMLKPVAAMLEIAPTSLPKSGALSKTGSHGPAGHKTGRVALLAGCANIVLAPSINEATIRVLNRAGFEVVVPPKAGCCGSLEHHLGKEAGAIAKVKANVDAWIAKIKAGGLDAIIINASGCGTTVKDYGHMLANDEAYRDKAAQIASLAKDITEFLSEKGLDDFASPQNMRVAYHSACSMQHGQKIIHPPRELLRKAGFEVVEIPEGHLCCGSAGVYNLLQSQLAGELKARKLENIARVNPQIIAAGNIGCITQLADDAGVPVAHTIELLDWAQGGPKPQQIK